MALAKSVEDQLGAYCGQGMNLQDPSIAGALWLVSNQLSSILA